MTAPADPQTLQDQAREILQQNRFHGRRTPGPFRGILEWLGDRFAPVLRLFEPVGGFFIEVWANTVARIALIAIVLGLAALLSLVAIRRRTASAVVRSARHALGESDDPGVLEDAADQAERGGDYAMALRLRFRAGVIRLQLAGRVRRGRTTTTHALARQLHSPAFDDLGRTFDAVAYGGSAATPDDARAAREQWQRVLSEKAS